MTRAYLFNYMLFSYDNGILPSCLFFNDFSLNLFAESSERSLRAPTATLVIDLSAMELLASKFCGSKFVLLILFHSFSSKFLAILSLCNLFYVYVVADWLYCLCIIVFLIFYGIVFLFIYENSY
jgi:hypothetical protein